MSSSNHNHTLPSPDISDMMSLLSVMKRQNEEILSKLNSIEDDNRKLRQELQEMKNYQKHIVKVSSRKHNHSEDEAEHKNEQSSSNKRARMSVANFHEPPASFNTLDDDCLGNVLDFLGKKCYSAFGRVNKRCNEMFCSKGLPKVTYVYGYAPINIIQQRQGRWYKHGLSIGVLHYNRRDILEWILAGGTNINHLVLDIICRYAIEKSRLDILREVFQRANLEQLERLRECYYDPDLCCHAAEFGKLECLKLLRENECEWDHWTWYRAKKEGNEHILPTILAR